MTTVPDIYDVIRRSFELLLPSFTLHGADVEEAVMHISALAVDADQPAPIGFVPGIPCVVYNEAGKLLPRVNLTYTEPVSLGDVLAEIGLQADVQVSYHPTGIVVWRPAPETRPVPPVAGMPDPPKDPIKN